MFSNFSISNRQIVSFLLLFVLFFSVSSQFVDLNLVTDPTAWVPLPPTTTTTTTTTTTKPTTTKKFKLKCDESDICQAYSDLYVNYTKILSSNPPCYDDGKQYCRCNRYKRSITVPTCTGSDHEQFECVMQALIPHIDDYILSHFPNITFNLTSVLAQADQTFYSLHKPFLSYYFVIVFSFVFIYLLKKILWRYFYYLFFELLFYLPFQCCKRTCRQVVCVPLANNLVYSQDPDLIKSRMKVYQQMMSPEQQGGNVMDNAPAPNVVAEPVADKSDNTVDMKSEEKAPETTFKHANLALSKGTNGVFPYKRFNPKCAPLNKNFEASLSKFFFVDTFNWTTTTNGTVPLYNLELPNGLWALRGIYRIFHFFVFARFDIEIMFTMNGSPYSVGMLMAAIKPYGPTTSTLTHNSAFPHITMTPQTAESAVMLVPYNTNNLYYTASGEPASYTMQVTQMAPLRSTATAPTSIQIDVYARPVNVEGKVPQTLSIVPQGWFSTTNITNNVAVQNMANSTLPVEVNGDSFDTQVSGFGLDYPSDTRQVSKGHIFQNVTNCDSILNVQKMSLVGSAINLPTCFLTGPDEMDFSYYKKKFVYYGSFQASTTNTKGQRLGVIPLMLPQSSNFITYLSLKYRQFTGGFIIRFIVNSTAYDRGKLFVALLYNNFAPPATMNDAAGVIDIASSPGIVIDFSSDQQIYDIKIPFHSPYLALNTTSIATSALARSYSLGSLALYSLMPLTVSAATPTIRDVVVQFALDDDFQFIYTVPAALGLVYTQAEAKVKVFELDKDHNPCAKVSMYGKDYFKSFKQLFTQFTYLNTLNVYCGPTVTSNILGENAFIYEVDADLTRTIDGAYMFNSFTGDLRFKFELDSHTNYFGQVMGYYCTISSESNLSTAEVGYYMSRVSNFAVIGDASSPKASGANNGPAYLGRTINNLAGENYGTVTGLALDTFTFRMHTVTCPQHIVEVPLIHLGHKLRASQTSKQYIAFSFTTILPPGSTNAAQQATVRISVAGADSFRAYDALFIPSLKKTKFVGSNGVEYSSAEYFNSGAVS